MENGKTNWASVWFLYQFKAGCAAIHNMGGSTVFSFWIMKKIKQAKNN